MPQFDKWIKQISPSDELGRIVRASVRQRLDAVEYYLQRAAFHADESIEYVHQLRVFTRRALAALDLFSEFLPKSEAKWFRKTLHKIRRAAGKARDLDVLIENHCTDKGQAAREFQIDLLKRRGRAQQPIVSMYRKLCEKDRFAQQARALRKQIPRTKHKPFGTWATDKLKKFTKPFFKTSSIRNDDLSKLHQFRIRGKELRYAMELLAPAFPKSFRKKLYPIVTELQTQIGAIHDHAVATTRFEKWLVNSSNARKTKHIQKLLDAEQQKLEAQLREFHAWWTPESESEFHELFTRLTTREPEQK